MKDEHVWQVCTAGSGGRPCGVCNVCNLNVCSVCGGWEAGLTTECCGRRLTNEEDEKVTNGCLDYKRGKWERHD